MFPPTPFIRLCHAAAVTPPISPNPHTHRSNQTKFRPTSAREHASRHHTDHHCISDDGRPRPTSSTMRAVLNLHSFEIRSPQHGHTRPSTSPLTVLQLNQRRTQSPPRANGDRETQHNISRAGGVRELQRNKKQSRRGPGAATQRPQMRRRPGAATQHHQSRRRRDPETQRLQSRP